MRKLLALTVIAFALGGAGGTSTAHANSDYEIVKRAVCHYFSGNLCWQAMSVVKCETGGTYSVWAGYGKHQFLGLFQMGSKERAKYGHGNNAWAQAQAAKRYYDDGGWGHWQCIPGGGLRW